MRLFVYLHISYIFFIIIHTGPCVNKNECIKPVFYNNFNSRSCNNNNYELSSVKYPAVKTSGR